MMGNIDRTEVWQSAKVSQTTRLFWVPWLGWRLQHTQCWEMFAHTPYLTPRISDAGKVHWCKPFCGGKIEERIQLKAGLTAVIHLTNLLLWHTCTLDKKKKAHSPATAGMSLFFGALTLLESTHMPLWLNIHRTMYQGWETYVFPSAWPLRTFTAVTCFRWTVRLSSSLLTLTMAGWRSLLGSRMRTWNCTTPTLDEQQTLSLAVVRRSVCPHTNLSFQLLLSLTGQRSVETVVFELSKSNSTQKSTVSCLGDLASGSLANWRYKVYVSIREDTNLTGGEDIC